MRSSLSPPPSPLPTPRKAWSFALAVAAEPIFSGVCRALGTRSGVSSPSPVRLRPFFLWAPHRDRGGAKLTTPCGSASFLLFSLGSGPSPKEASCAYCSPVVSRMLGKPALFRGSEGGKERLEEGIIVRERGPPDWWGDPWGQMPPPPLNGLAPAFSERSLARNPNLVLPCCVTLSESLPLYPLWAPVIPKASSNAKIL